MQSLRFIGMSYNGCKYDSHLHRGFAVTFVEFSAFAGLVFGVVGTALGVLNAIHQVADRRVRLRLIPHLAFQTDSGFLLFKPPLRRDVYASCAPFPAFEVLNQSRFAIIIDQVGFCTSRGRRGNRVPLHQVYSSNDERLPIKLEARQSVSLYGGHYAFAEIPPEFAYAYVSTNCDTWAQKDAHGVLASWRQYSNSLG